MHATFRLLKATMNGLFCHAILTHLTFFLTSIQIRSKHIIAKLQQQIVVDKWVTHKVFE